MIGNLFSGVAMKVSAGLIGLLLIFSGIQTYRLSERTEQRDLARAELQAEQAKHAVTLASISALKNQLDEQNLAVQRLQREADAAVARGQRELTTARAENVRQAGQIERLRSSARSMGNPIDPCEVSDTLKEAEGL